MKVVQINAVCNASTGKIAVAISKLLSSKNIENYILYTSGKSDYTYAIKYANVFNIKLSALQAKLTGKYGFYSKAITKRLIQKIDEIQPDVIHLHNLHGHNVNLTMFFQYLKSLDVKIVWTFHDCWSFTGYCTHFDYVKCEKWKTCCQNCLQRKKFSWLFDRSKNLFLKKKNLFCGFRDLTIVTPSQWLADLVKQSFFAQYPVQVIHNGIDVTLFQPSKSNFREKYSLEDKKIILSVAMGINERKGYFHYLRLASMLPEDMKIVLAGVSKKQKRALPANIIGIEKTANQAELVEIYSAADVFVNCTMEDNFPTVNLEALACGTPVITFRTGGSVECVDKNTGVVVEQGDLVDVVKAIQFLLHKENVGVACRERAKQFFSDKDCFEKYIDLYRVTR